LTTLGGSRPNSAARSRIHAAALGSQPSVRPFRQVLGFDYFGEIILSRLLPPYEVASGFVATIGQDEDGPQEIRKIVADPITYFKDASCHQSREEPAPLPDVPREWTGLLNVLLSTHVSSLRRTSDTPGTSIDKRPVGPARDDVEMVDEYPEEKRWQEYTKGGLEIILNAVPVVGGSTTTALTMALSHRLNKRRDAWFRSLAQIVEQLGERLDAFEPEHLADNDAFMDAVVTATRIVDRTSKEEKIHLLRNAVLNAAMPSAPDADLQQVYFGTIDELTATHLHLLILLNDPPRWFEVHPDLQRPTFAFSSNRAQLIEAAMPDLATAGREVTARFYAALERTGLIGAPLSGMMTEDGAWQPATTRFGKNFLAFLVDPLLEEPS
jgi:hypothetical protein